MTFLDFNKSAKVSIPSSYSAYWTWMLVDMLLGFIGSWLSEQIAYSAAFMSLLDEKSGWSSFANVKYDLLADNYRDRNYIRIKYFCLKSLSVDSKFLYIL